jgi:hypothetical protein
LRQADARDTDALLARFPGPVTLYPRRPVVVLILVACAGLTVFAVYLLLNAIDAWTSDVIRASLAILVCGGLTIRLTLTLFMPGMAGLTLDESGFAIAGVLRATRFTWREVSGFRVETDEVKVVKFEVARRGRTATRELGYYAMPVADVALLMNAWRERALALPRPASVPHVGHR